MAGLNPSGMGTQLTFVDHVLRGKRLAQPVRFQINCWRCLSASHPDLLPPCSLCFSYPTAPGWESWGRSVHLTVRIPGSCVGYLGPLHLESQRTYRASCSLPLIHCQGCRQEGPTSITISHLCLCAQGSQNTSSMPKQLCVCIASEFKARKARQK